MSADALREEKRAEAVALLNAASAAPYQTVALSAVRYLSVLEPSPLEQMIEARQWLEGIRAERERQLRWEFGPAPAFAA